MNGRSLSRLLQPRSIAFVGGKAAEEALRQCRDFGYSGAMWPVNPKREEMAGERCFSDISGLPSPPDAVFLAAPAEPSITLAGELAASGAGGAICYASEFAEVGPAGRDRQYRLVEAAAGMPLIGPNCYGMLNAFDRVALWPDQHGCQPIKEGRGVAIISQSGNLALNLTMQARGLPIGYVISIGNCADVTPAELIEALIADRRVSAIGLHLEGLGSVARFSQASINARAAGVPLVVLKTGSSIKGAALTLSHTSSLAGSEPLCDVLFDRYGVARAYDPSSFLEALKLLHVAGPLSGKRITSASCSGGEASLVADFAERLQLETPDFAASVQSELEQVLGPRVAVANPLDYHTYIWGDAAAQTRCFSALLKAGFEASILILDFPRADRCESDEWEVTLNAFVAAHRAIAPARGSVRIVASSLAEGMPERVARMLLENGILPANGLTEVLASVAAAARIGMAWSRSCPPMLHDEIPASPGVASLWDEARSKAALRAAGVPIPSSKLVSMEELKALGHDACNPLPVQFPVVLKAVGNDLAHKTEVGGVALNISSREELLLAAERMTHLSDRFLVEDMVNDVVAELLVGIGRDPQFGLFMTIGAGGVFVELLRSVEHLLLPASRSDIEAALSRLPAHQVLAGFRGQPGCDMIALVDAIEAVARFAETHAAHLEEMDINPLFALPKGAVAVDALIRMRGGIA